MQQPRLNSVGGLIPTILLGCVISSLKEESYKDLPVGDADSGSSTSSTSIQLKQPSFPTETTTTSTTKSTFVPSNKSRKFLRFASRFNGNKSNKDSNINQHHESTAKMFCPPPVREKYLKKYGKKRVEEYERRMLRGQQQQKNGDSSLLEVVDDREHRRISSKKLKRFLHNGKSKKNKNRGIYHDEADASTSGAGNENGVRNGDDSRRWTDKDSKALLELGENGKIFLLDDDKDDDESHLDNEFNAYSSGSSCCSDSTDDDHKQNGDKVMEDMYHDSDDSNCYDDDDANENGRKKDQFTNTNLWLTPESSTNNSLRLMNSQGKVQSKTSEEPTSDTKSNHSNSNNNTNVFGMFANAIGGFFNGNSNHSNHHRISNKSTRHQDEGVTSANDDIAFLSQDEQQKRADALLSALGVFGIASFHDEQHQSRDRKAILDKLSIPDMEPTESSTSDYRADYTTTPATVASLCASISFEDEADDYDDDEALNEDDQVLQEDRGNTVPYFGGTYEDNGEEEAEVDVRMQNNNTDEILSKLSVKDDDDHHDAVSVLEMSSTQSSSRRRRRRRSRTKRTITVEDNNKLNSSVHSVVTASTSADKEQSLLNMDISVLAQTFAVSRNILDEDCQPSPEQKRMLISHYAQLQRKKTTKHKQQMQKKLSSKNNGNEDDEIVDIDEDEKGHDNSSDDDDAGDDDEDAKRSMEIVVTKESKKKNMKSGLNHVGSDVFLATQRRSRYYGSASSNGSVISYGSGRSAYSRRGGCRSVTSLSNIDEDSVVEITDDNHNNSGLPMVNRLLLTPSSPGTVWEDHRGNVIVNRTYNNVIPEFKPRLEEDEVDEDSAEKSIDSDDNINVMNRSRQNDDDSRTVVSSSSSSRMSKIASPVKINNNLGIESPFCFGGILLATASHFNDTSMDESSGSINNIANNSNKIVETYNNYDDAISVTSESSRRSVSSSVSKMSTASKSSKAISELSSPLAALIHPMNRELFQNDAMEKTEEMKINTSSPKRVPTTPRKLLPNRNDDYGCDAFKSPLGAKTQTIVSYTPKKHNNDDMPLFNSEKYQIVGSMSSPGSEGRSRLASSFRSSSISSENRVAYNLSSGKKSMTKDERIKVQGMLPKRPSYSPEDLGLVAAPARSPSNPNDFQSPRENTPERNDVVFNLKESTRRLSLSGQAKLVQSSGDDETSLALARILMRNRNRTIGVLLIEPSMKIFEVVFLEDLNVQETTVGEVLAKVRSNAVDPTLSEQKYNSLCNDDQELAAPMLPVDYLLTNTTADNSQNLNNTPLLVAVPTGCTACEMQSIKKVLWANPKTARWWEQKDPTRPLLRSKSRSESSLVVNDENVESIISNEGPGQPIAA